MNISSPYIELNRTDLEAKKKAKTVQWEEIPRHDLHMIPLMEKHGWEVVFSWKDKQNERMYPYNVPHDPVTFKRGNLSAWENKKGWTVGQLVDGYFQYHRIYINVLDILAHE